MEFKVSSKTLKTVLVECEGLGLVNEHVSPDDNYVYESHDELESDEEHESDNEGELDEEHELHDEHERVKNTI